MNEQELEIEYLYEAIRLFCPDQEEKIGEFVADAVSKAMIDLEGL